MKIDPRTILLLAVSAALAGGGQSPASEATASIAYELKSDGKVSAAVYDAKGAQVRTLLNADAQTAGRHQLRWDGLDDDGQPVGAGTYTWKLLQTQGVTAEYLVSLGINPEPSYGGWPGNHGGVASVAADATGLYFAGGCSEGSPQIVKLSFDGKRLWTMWHGLDAWQGGQALACASGKLFLLQGDGIVKRINADTGDMEASWPVPDRGGDQDTLDLAARGDQLVVSYGKHDALVWIDPATGKVVDQVAVPAPRGVDIGSDGTVYVLSSNRLLRVTRADKTPAKVVEGLQEPFRVAVDITANDDLLVAEWGPDQQVKRFSRAGKLLASYGTPGGRPGAGLYDPNGFIRPVELTADGRGGFLVIDNWWTAPRRVAWFDKAGKFLREWYGGQMYSNFAAADPEDPTSVWIDSQFGSVIQCRVDYQRRNWSVAATYPVAQPPLVPMATHASGRWHPRHRQGRTYLCNDEWPVVLLVDEANRRARPVFSAGLACDWNGQWRIPEPWRDTSIKRPVNGVINFLWADRNGDGAVTRDELTFNTHRNITGGKCAIGPDLTYYIPLTWEPYTPQQKTTILILHPRDWLPQAGPVYDYEHAEFMQVVPESLAKFEPVAAGRDPAGALYVAMHSSDKPFGTGWAGRIGGNKIVKWDAAGQVAWAVGRHCGTMTTPPGEARYFSRVTGVTHGCVVVDDADYADRGLVHVWDEDGLCVGRLLDRHTDGLPDTAYQLCTENFGGTLYTVPAGMTIPGLATGDVLFFGAGQNSSPVYKITGWDQFNRQQGSFSVSEAQATAVTGALKTEAARPDVAHIPFIGDVKIDGSLAEWKKVRPLEIKDGTSVVARVYLGWNGTGLYAAFDVDTDRPWKTSATVPFAFQGGAGVDLNFGPDRVAAARQAGVGDKRVVASPLGVVEFVPVLPPDAPADRRQPATYQTGNGRVTFARVAKVKDQGMLAAVTKRRPPPLGEAPDVDPVTGHEPTLGYVVEFRVPLIDAEVVLRPGARFRFDASMILADPEGTRSAARLPWHSRAVDDTTVTDVFIESTLRPANWGEAVLE